MRKRLNRERLNVGRTTYADRVKAILRQCESDDVLHALAREVLQRREGRQRDEVQWAEIAQAAMQALNRSGRVVFVTEEQVRDEPDLVGRARDDGYEIVTISSGDQARLEAEMQRGGEEVRTLGVYAREYHDSFDYTFVDPRELTAAEAAIYALTPAAMRLVTAGPSPPVRISETMRADRDLTLGCWDADRREIVIHRRQLETAATYLGTLLHEAAHALTGAADATREFENVLTDYIGVAAAQLLD